jgi:MFS family permease
MGKEITVITLHTRPQTSLGRFFAAYPAAYWFLALGTVMNGVATFVLPFETLYLTTVRGFPITEAALAVSLFGIGSCMSGIFGGWLSDHIGRRPVILGSMLLLVLTTLFLGFATSLSWIAVLSFLYGFWTSAYRPASQAAVNDLIPGPRQGQANTLLYWSYNIGIAVSPLVASVMIHLAGYSLLFVADAAGTLIFCALVYWFVPESHPDRAPTAHVAGATRQRKQVKGGVLRDYVFLVFVALVFAIACLYFQNGSTLPMDMGLHGMSVEQYSLAIAMNGVAVVVLTLPLSRLFLRWSPFRALEVAALLFGIGYGMMAFAGWFRSLPLYVCSVLIWTLGEILYTPSSANVVAELASEHRRGLYQGIFRMAWGLASFAGPAAGGLLLSWSSTLLWLACLGAGMVIGLGFACAGQMHQYQRHRHLQKMRARYKYPVELDKKQRRFLESILKKQRGIPALERLHAHILLLSDTHNSLPRTTEEIAQTCHVTQATVVRVRRMLSERGFDGLFVRACAADPRLTRLLPLPRPRNLVVLAPVG